MLSDMLYEYLKNILPKKANIAMHVSIYGILIYCAALYKGEDFSTIFKFPHFTNIVIFLIFLIHFNSFFRKVKR